MNFIIAFAWASIMLCAGVFLRAKISFLRNMLVPASVIAGILGVLFMNVFMGIDILPVPDSEMYTTIVNNLFTLSFISISLTNSSTKENAAGNVAKGAVGIGLVWCLLYALTPIVAAGVIHIVGMEMKMPAIYGMLIQFAFCQGPGQSAAYGMIFEQYGWENASMVALTFSVIGFLVAFFIGVPAAKLGIQRGIAKNCGEINAITLRGYYKKEEQQKTEVNDTTCNSNIETLTIHFAIIGICYLVAVAISKILQFLPGFLGNSMSSMMFMNGMYAAYIIKWLIRKLKIDFLLDNVLQSKITGAMSDYLVVCSFMSISINVISKWSFPIIITSIVITIITFFVCFYFGQRFGGKNDFERTLGLFGTCTGTVPTGIALVRIVDPNFQTTTAVELGASNLTMLASTPVYIIILGLASGTIGMPVAVGGLCVCVVAYLCILKITRVWNQKSFSWKK